MERRKFYISIFILAAFLILTPSVYRLAMEKSEANNLDLAKAYLESFGWNPSFMTSAGTSVDEKAASDFENFKYRAIASQDIGLDYLKFKGMKVRLYAFKVDKEYQDKPIYAHVLIYKGRVIGAYLQSKTDNLNEVYVFSLRDGELQHPNIN